MPHDGGPVPAPGHCVSTETVRIAENTTLAEVLKAKILAVPPHRFRRQLHAQRPGVPAKSSSPA